MSQFLTYRKEIEKAIIQCVELAADYRKSNETKEVPFQNIQDLVHQYIMPLGGKENRLNVSIPEGSKQDWRRNATELVFRRTLFFIVRLEENEERYQQIFDCLDIVLYCSGNDVDLIDNVVPLTLLEELCEVHTTIGCEKIFNYIEHRKDKITVDMVPGKGKGLILLRMCNELLRRLSKETSTVFCGRILMFLANSFPLGERSGVNLRGDFNTDMVHYDTPEEVDADPTMSDDQKEFYKLFWSTRHYFANPPTIFVDDNFNKLQNGTNKIVERFKLIADKEAEISGSRKKNEGVAIKRDRVEYERNISDISGDNADDAEEMLALINRDYKFPRLLSSRKLLGLELEDIKFRRSVIVQYLILFQYLLSFSEEEREKTKEMLALVGTTKQSLVQPTFTLSEDQIKWIQDTKEMFVKLLRSIKPHGNSYTDIILSILDHERHWIFWKTSGCPPFEKKPVDIKEMEKNWSNKKRRLETPPNKFRFSHGSHEVSKLFNTSKENTSLSKFMLNRPKYPSSVDVIDKSITELDDSLEPSQERFNYASGATLQATRLMYIKRPTFIRHIYTVKKEVYKEMREKLNEDAEMEEKGEDKKTSTTSNFVIGAEKTEDHHVLDVLMLLILYMFVLFANAVRFSTTKEMKKINIFNHCQHTLQIGYQMNLEPEGRTIELNANKTYPLFVEPTWAGRLWARENCDTHKCELAGATNPASLAEFRFSSITTTNTDSSDIDYYDVSFVDGYNFPLSIRPRIVYGLDRLVKLDNKHCRKSECLHLPNCPSDLQTFDKLGKFVACESACSRYGTDTYCCTGRYNTSATCTSNYYARQVKNMCPFTYSYAFDDANSVYACKTNEYDVIFCP
ncbi:THO complex subunit 1 transcription elongation factor-domain-containing protein [Cokeromyces recurvatus]|uniref:THO complex subunit 1 transcription elongation factor-domain-containing protein n=1 Tax=Cokeromyces recurvatus TaxID=90255 RepID=UPI002220FE54|nr:THO complex subunit 1 transcription elongation factor-domain-containing protein [Cokeromyces recurvatus]KAI7906379.1 THO complex subunit 1 transcription elongation factor-domain-containing protein [Cokeromyces recurvatus]